MTSRSESPKPLAVVLATTAGESDAADPVISYQPVGTGRVVVVEGTGMWRWAFLPPQHQEYDEVYGNLWRSLVRWLVSQASLLPNQPLALRSDKVNFATHEPATATLLVREGVLSGAPPTVELTGDTLATPQTSVPVPAGSAAGQYRVEFGRLAAGRYRARTVSGDPELPTADTAFDVRGNLSERLNVAARPDLMRLIADDSGGAELTAAEPAELIQRFDDHLTRAMPQHLLRQTVWDRWWVLVSVIGLWAMAWSVRRRFGLI